MQQKFWTFPKAYNKSKWGDGPWMKEPDKAQYRDPDTNLPCLVVRNMVGALCGYVGVYGDHPLHGVSCEDGALSELVVHGGLTYADLQGEPRLDHHSPEHFIGVEFEEGDDRNIWFFGYDCAHAGDYCPMYAEWKMTGLADLKGYQSYKEITYVVEQNTRLAEFLALQMPQTLRSPLVTPEPRIVKPLGRRKIGPRE